MRTQMAFCQGGKIGKALKGQEKVIIVAKMHSRLVASLEKLALFSMQLPSFRNAGVSFENTLNGS
jgi:hypothetical protein